MRNKLLVSVLSGALLGLSGCQTLSGSATAQTLPLIEPGKQVRGELTTANAINFNDGSRHAIYPINVREGEFYKLELTGNLTGQLAVFNEHQDLVANGATVHFKAETTGRYQVAVNGQGGGSYGPFSLNVSRLDMETNQVLVPGRAIDAWLPQNGSGLHLLSLDESGFYQIDLKSQDFDTVLLVTGPGGFRAEDDDGGEDTNSRINDELQPGQYQVRVNGYGGGSGIYSLEVNKLELSTNRELSVPARVAGFLRNNPDVYTLQIEQAGEYVIEMRSSALDSYLKLDGPNDFSVEDDDGAGNLDARIGQHLQPGTYRLSASAFDNSGSGSYTLTVQRR